MKKIAVLFVLVIVLVLSLAACSNIPYQETQSPSASAVVIKGKIVDVGNSTSLVADSTSAELYAVTTKLSVLDADGKLVDLSALKAGQTVEIGYSGTVMETYPAQPYKPAYIKITGQGDDLVGFYKNVLNDLWKEDSGLNPNSGMLAFDLSQATNLTEAEKAALVYVVSNAYGLQGIAGTFDELVQKGLIDKEKLIFENGMLFTIKITDASENSFMFDASKWRSGTGAYLFNNCKAVKNNGGWSYTTGSAAIS